jgi:hypothetical protein
MTYQCMTKCLIRALSFLTLFALNLSSRLVARSLLSVVGIGSPLLLLMVEYSMVRCTGGAQG